MALILLTAHDELEPSAAERMGFSASLTKPVRQSSLLMRLPTSSMPDACPLHPPGPPGCRR